jgi:hypothetical protein
MSFSNKIALVVCVVFIGLFWIGLLWSARALLKPKTEIQMTEEQVDGLKGGVKIVIEKKDGTREEFDLPPPTISTEVGDNLLEHKKHDQEGRLVELWYTDASLEYDGNPVNGGVDGKLRFHKKKLEYKDGKLIREVFYDKDGQLILKRMH